MAEPRQIFSARTLTKVRDIVGDLVQDSTINTVVKYRKFNDSVTFNPENQGITSAYTDYKDVGTLKGYFSDREVLLSGGMLELGDVRFLVQKDLISGTPRVKDIVVESGVSYNVMNVWTDPFDISFVFQCREV